ncbi:MAG: hypothetical protein ACJ768_02330 [Gaiellaceae bacterium]
MKTRPRTDDEAIHFLVARVPELRPLYEEHVSFNEELLPYVLFECDLTPWFVDAVRRGTSEEPARRFAEAVETLMDTRARPRADDSVWNLAGVAFTESLVAGEEDDVVARAWPWFGPSTRRDIKYLRRPRPVLRLKRTLRRLRLKSP